MKQKVGKQIKPIEIKIFGEAQLDGLRQFRDFNNGIPTRYSIGRIIRGIKAESLISSFINFSNTVRQRDKKEHISFDGKVVCGYKHGDIDALQLMTAMVVNNDLIIYQKETLTKTNEIPVMPSMLASMDIKNTVITADSMHCQTDTTELIRKGKGDYVLQVKKNQSNLYKEIAAYFHKVSHDPPEILKENLYCELDDEHGRINEREYRQLPISEWFDESKRFKDSFAVVEVNSKKASALLRKRNEVKFRFIRAHSSRSLTKTLYIALQVNHNAFYDWLASTLTH